MIFLKNVRYVWTTLMEAEMDLYGKKSYQRGQSSLVDHSLRTIYIKSKKTKSEVWRDLLKVISPDLKESKENVFIKIPGDTSKIEVVKHIKNNALVLKRVYKKREQFDYFYLAKSVFRKRPAIVIIRLLASDGIMGAKRMQYKVLLRKTTKALAKTIKEKL